jgi:hypothetical protein
MTKEYGPAVSGYNIPDGRAWETVVFEAGKPVLDRELNLSQDVDGGTAQAVLRRSTPSGWLADDFLGRAADATGQIYSPSAVANQLEIPNDLIAHVNGWLIKVAHSYATGSNSMDLGAAPTGQGAQRTDVVFLEVWRRLLSAAPDTVGKSATARIWRNGNVATDPANDLVLNYPDDILDTNVGSETTKRVQIQHRLRVVQGVNLAAYPYALDDPSIVAHTVPPDAATPEGVATALPYVNQSSNGDPGLWIAGDGNPANGLGTVDGYMYAIPLVAVFRRNDTAFDRRLNHNGGVASPGPSDRPDGFFYDIVRSVDLMDLRMGVSPTGWDLNELLEKNVNALFDNTLRTEFANTSPYGGGNTGTSVLIANEIGISDANGGNGTDTGTTGSGSLAGQFDAVRRRFSGRSVFETVTVVVDAPGGGWVGNDVVQVDPTAMAIYPYAAFNWSSYAPARVRFIDVLDTRFLATNPDTSYEGSPYIQSIEGLGAAPITPLTITMTGGLPGGLTTEPLLVTLLVGYPTGVGLSHTPIEDYGTASFSINNPGQLPPSPDPVAYDSLVNPALDHPHREVNLQYSTDAITFTTSAADLNPEIIYMPERVHSLTSVLVNGFPPAGFTNLDSTGRIITVGPTPTPGDEIEVNYNARRPLPQNDEQITIYYRAAAMQTARSALLSASLDVTPKVTSSKMYALTVGSGSQDEGYPFPTAYVQTGGIFPSNSFVYSGEGELSGRAEISVADFDAQTGLLSLPVYVPMVASPDSLTFERGLADADIEGRTFFKEVPAGYIPNAYAQDLSNPDRHKDIFPILAELSEDTPLGYRGQLVLVLLIRYAIFDATNGVFFDADLNDNTTTAAVFRIQGNLISKRAS